MHGLVKIEDMFDLAIKFRTWSEAGKEIIFGDDALSTWHYYHRREDGKYEHVINFENTFVHIDYDDVQVRITDYDEKKWEVKVWMDTRIYQMRFYYIARLLIDKKGRAVEIGTPKDPAPAVSPDLEFFVDKKTHALMLK